MRKEISIIISAVFMITLMTSSPLSSVNVASALVHDGQDFLYSVSVSSTFVRVQQGDFGTYDVQVLRGSNAGQFSVALSLISDSSLPKAAVSFDPPTLNFEQGQTAGNSTLKINSQNLVFGTTAFRVQATTQPPAIPDKALSNPAALIVRTAETRQSANSLTDSDSQSSSSSESLPSVNAQRNMAESLPTKLNNPPIAKAGQDQVIKEGERVVLDGSASTDPDKTPLSFLWEQISPRQPTVKLDSSETSNKVSFVIPDVDRDTIFRFKLVVKDGNGGQAADSINILARNVEASALPESPSPKQEEQQNQEPASQEFAPNSDSDSGAASDQDPTRTENHSPIAEAQQTLSTGLGKSLSISLKGNDPDKDDKISFVILTNPLHGTIAGFDKTSGLMTYVPSSAFTGQDRLAYNVVDSRGAKSNDGLVVIRIFAVDSQTPSSQSSRPGSLPDTSPSNVSSSLLSPSPSIPNQNTGSPLTQITNDSAVMAGDNKSSISAPLTQITNDSAVMAGDNKSSISAPLTQITNDSAVTPAQNNTKAKTFSSFAASSVQAGEEYQFIKKWGSLGSGNGQFNNPHGIAVVRSSGDVFILDTGNNRVQKFDSNGNFVLKWGSLGSGNGQFNNAHGIAVDQSSGEVYVTDTGNNRVQKFSSTGTWSLSFNGKAPGSSQFNLPEGVAVSSGFVYVSDVNNHRIVKLNTNGQFVAKWGATGDGQGQFKGPHGVAVDSGSNVYVSDFLNNKVQKFTSTGGFLTSWGSSGSADGQFNAPHGIAVDSDDSVYVSDRGNNRVQKFNNAGGFLTKFGSACTIQPCPKDGQFNGPDGIGVSSSGSVYVTDIGNNRVQVFAIAAASPTVLSTQPQNGAVDVPLDSVINANFSKAMDITTINTDNFKLFTEDGVTPVAGTVSLSSDNKNATFTPTSSLSTSPTYKGTIKGGATGVKDIAGNPLAADYLWSFSMRASITITSLNTTTPKWGSAINVTGTVSNFVSTDKIVVDWGDGTPSTQISPILPGGHFSAIHTYSVSAIGVHNVVAKLQTIGGVVKATSGVKVITVQKHTSALTVDMKPTESPQCANCPFYVIGKLTDSDSIPPNKEVGGKTIVLSGSGASSLANPVHTGGVIFSGTPSENLTLTSSVLQMPPGSVISLPAGTHGVAFKFNGAVGVTLTKGNDQTIQLNVASAEFDAREGVKKITIGSGSGELEILNTRDFAVDGTDDHQIAVDFSQNIAAQGSYSTLAVSPGSYFSSGVTQTQDGSALKIVASFDGASDPAYLGATSPELSYDVSRAAGVGEGTATAYSGLVWTKLTVGTGIAGDACTVNSVAGTDNDKDGICDRWEDPLNSAAGNDATHRYIACPTVAGPLAIDPNCANTNGSIKYNLCISDAFASVWGNKADGSTICPTPGHKDIYVEIDYMANHLPSSDAIKKVITAFGNAPVSNSNPDAFNRGGGITLHVVVSDQFGRVAPYNVWTDATPSLDDFRGVKEANFGTAAERAGTSGMPGMTAVAWTSTGKIQKHYVFHYGQWITYYGGTCTSSGLSSGLAELLGNDFIVSLGCSFGGSDPSGGSIGTVDEQAGTFMHELGHNLNLAHGGAATLAIGSANYNMNCKPNYLSVMNYARQMPNAVLDAVSWEAGFNYAGSGTQTALDYARSTIADGISEGTASETTNFVSSDAKQNWVLYGTPTKVPAVRKVSIPAAGATVDWDGSGTKAGTVSVDLNALSPTVAGCGPIANPSAFPNSPDLPQSLKSYSDWDKVNLVFVPDGDSQDGVTQRVSQPFINKNTQELKPVFLQSIQDVALQMQFVPPPNPDGSSTFKTGSTVPLKFNLKDKNGNSIPNAVVTLVAEKGSGTIVGSTPFVYSPATAQYKYEWITPKAVSAVGEWTLKYILNYHSTNPALPESVLLGPFATGPYTLKITGTK